MRMRSGYKLSEIGIIPDDWDMKRLGDLAKLNRLSITPESQPDQQFTHYSLPAFDEGKKAQIEIGNKIGSSKYRVPQNAVLVSKLNPRIPRVWEPEVIPENAIASTEWLVLTPHEGINKSFLFAACSSPYFCKQMELATTGTTGSHQRVSPSTALDIRIATPTSRKEQAAIAIVLSDMDSLLQTLDRLIAKKRNIQQAIMQQLLTGKTRLPGFNGQWEVKRIGQICDISMGSTPSRLNTTYWGEGHIWLSIADLHSKVVTDSKEEITTLAATSMNIVREGTLMMSFKLSIGRLSFAGCDLFTNEAICSFNNLQANADYLYYAMSRIDFSLYGKQAVKGCTLNKESLNTIEVRLPSQAEQSAIATILSDMDSELTELEAQREKTNAIKLGMMQELLTGKKRLISIGNRHA